MKNTKQTLAVILLVAVLIVGGLSLVSMQKEMAQAVPEDSPEPNDHDMPDGVENTNETSALPNGNETAN